MSIWMPPALLTFVIWTLPLLLAVVILANAPDGEVGCVWFLLLGIALVVWYAFAFWRFA